MHLIPFNDAGYFLKQFFDHNIKVSEERELSLLIWIPKNNTLLFPNLDFRTIAQLLKTAYKRHFSTNQEQITLKKVSIFTFRNNKKNVTVKAYGNCTTTSIAIFVMSISWTL